LGEPDNLAIIEILQKGNLNEAASMLEELMRKVTSPTATGPRKSKPWFTEACYKAREMALEALHVARTQQTKKQLNFCAKKGREYKEITKESQKRFWEEEERRFNRRG
jgi:hypothetical protein